MMTYGNLERAVWGLKFDCLPFGTTKQQAKRLWLQRIGFIKKLNQVPQREIERASVIRKKYFSDEKDK